MHAVKYLLKFAGVRCYLKLTSTVAELQCEHRTDYLADHTADQTYLVGAAVLRVMQQLMSGRGLLT